MESGRFYDNDRLLIKCRSISNGFLKCCHQIDFVKLMYTITVHLHVFICKNTGIFSGESLDFLCNCIIDFFFPIVGGIMAASLMVWFTALRSTHRKINIDKRQENPCKNRNTVVNTISRKTKKKTKLNHTNSHCNELNQKLSQKENCFCCCWQKRNGKCA